MPLVDEAGRVQCYVKDPPQGEVVRGGVPEQASPSIGRQQGRPDDQER